MDVIKNSKKLRESNDYVNEHLTKRNSDLAHTPQKKKNEVDRLGTEDDCSRQTDTRKIMY